MGKYKKIYLTLIIISMMATSAVFFNATERYTTGCDEVDAIHEPHNESDRVAGCRGVVYADIDRCDDLECSNPRHGYRSEEIAKLFGIVSKDTSEDNSSYEVGTISWNRLFNMARDVTTSCYRKEFSRTPHGSNEHMTLFQTDTPDQNSCNMISTVAHNENIEGTIYKKAYGDTSRLILWETMYRSTRNPTGTNTIYAHIANKYCHHGDRAVKVRTKLVTSFGGDIVNDVEYAVRDALAGPGAMIADGSTFAHWALKKIGFIAHAIPGFAEVLGLYKGVKWLAKYWASRTEPGDSPQNCAIRPEQVDLSFTVSCPVDLDQHFQCYPDRSLENILSAAKDTHGQCGGTFTTEVVGDYLDFNEGHDEGVRRLREVREEVMSRPSVCPDGTTQVQRTSYCSGTHGNIDNPAMKIEVVDVCRRPKPRDELIRICRKRMITDCVNSGCFVKSCFAIPSDNSCTSSSDEMNISGVLTRVTAGDSLSQNLITSEWNEINACRCLGSLNEDESFKVCESRVPQAEIDSGKCGPSRFSNMRPIDVNRRYDVRNNYINERINPALDVIRQNQRTRSRARQVNPGQRNPARNKVRGNQRVQSGIQQSNSRQITPTQNSIQQGQDSIQETQQNNMRRFRNMR